MKYIICSLILIGAILVSELLTSQMRLAKKKMTIKSVIQDLIDTNNAGMPDYQKREILEVKMKLLREEFEGYKQEYPTTGSDYVEGFNAAIDKIIREQLT